MTDQDPGLEAPRIGDRIAGRFALIAEAGRGGMGTVFRARDRRDGRDVAIKVLRRPDVESLTRFSREAALLADLCHPNLVGYLGHGVTPDGISYLVMEWLVGTTLAHRLAHIGVSAADSVAIAIQVCRALAALHARGIVHRDLKPSNIMLVDDRLGDGAVKVVDLGVARRRDEIGALTRSGAVVGTAGYLAPEQARGRAADVDERSDLFALGCVLYACLAGAPPFTGDSTLAVYTKVLVHDPPPLAAIDPSLPPALTALVDALLARVPARRPASAAEVERALAALDVPRVASRPQPGPAAPTRTAAPRAGLIGLTPGGEPLAEAAGALDEAIDRGRALAAEAPAAMIVCAADTVDGRSWIDRAAAKIGALVLAHRLAGSAGDTPSGIFLVDEPPERP